MDLMYNLFGLVIFVLTQISCVLFYRKSNLRKSNLMRWINKKVSRKGFAVFISSLLYLITMSRIRATGISGNYYNLIEPFLLAFYLSIIPILFIDKYSIN